MRRASEISRVVCLVFTIAQVRSCSFKNALAMKCPRRYVVDGIMDLFVSYDDPLRSVTDSFKATCGEISYQDGTS